MVVEWWCCENLRWNGDGTVGIFGMVRIWAECVWNDSRLVRIRGGMVRILDGMVVGAFGVEWCGMVRIWVAWCLNGESLGWDGGMVRFGNGLVSIWGGMVAECLQNCESLGWDVCVLIPLHMDVRDGGDPAGLNSARQGERRHHA